MLPFFSIEDSWAVTFEIYINNALVLLRRETRYPANVKPFFIGASPSGKHSMNGRVYNVMITKNAFTDKQVDTLFKNNKDEVLQMHMLCQGVFLVNQEELRDIGDLELVRDRDIAVDVNEEEEEEEEVVKEKKKKTTKKTTKKIVEEGTKKEEEVVKKTIVEEEDVKPASVSKVVFFLNFLKLSWTLLTSSPSHKTC